MNQTYKLPDGFELGSFDAKKRTYQLVPIKPIVEVWKWYRFKVYGTIPCLIFITKIEGTKVTGYGWIYSNWADETKESYVCEISDISELIEAPESYVKDRLIEEANNKYKKLDNVKSLYNTFNGEIDGNFYIINPDKIEVWCKTSNNCNVCLFNDGQWAEILPNEEPILTLEQKVEVLWKERNKK